MQRNTTDLSLIAQGGCYVCARGDNLVNTEVSVPYEGLLAICTGCLMDGLSTVGHRTWTPEREAELEDAKIRARDSEALQRVAEDAVIDMVTVSGDIAERRRIEAEEALARTQGRDSKGHFVKKLPEPEPAA